MRHARVIAVLVLFVLLGAGFWWWTTRADRAAQVMDTRGMVEEGDGGLLEASPADSAAAAADTVGGVID